MSLEEAYKALEESEREFSRYSEVKEKVMFRDACEKAWIAIFLATDYLLMSKGFAKPKSGQERRLKLLELEKKWSRRLKNLDLETGLGLELTTFTPSDFMRVG